MSAAREGAEGARESAEDILAEELAKTEEALNAAEELSKIEIAAAKGRGGGEDRREGRRDGQGCRGGGAPDGGRGGRRAGQG